MLRVIEDLAGDWRRLDERIEGLVDPQAWLANVFARINDHAIHRLDQLLPWNWKTHPARLAA
jgi:hypothetical protein